MFFNILMSKSKRVKKKGDQNHLKDKKNAIQHQVPLALPCYDLNPITNLVIASCRKPQSKINSQM